MIMVTGHGLTCHCTKSSKESQVKSKAKKSKYIALSSQAQEPHSDSSSVSDVVESHTLLQEMDDRDVIYQPIPDHYQLQNVIGSGCHGCSQIYMATHVPTAQQLAIKKINLEKCPIDFNLLQHEVMMQRLLHHNNLLSCYCSFVSNNEIWAIYPLMAYGSCHDLLHAHFTEGLSELAIAHILRDVLQGLEYLHGAGIIHRAVRASHILVSDTGRACLVGLRFSYSMMESGRRLKSVYHFPDHYESSLLWASPELLEQNLAGYDTKSDVYSLGITACELANGVVPFADMPSTQMLLEKIEGTQPQLLDTITIPELQNAMITEDGQPSNIGKQPYQRTFSQSFHSFVKDCLHADPLQRPTATSLLQHSFFKQIRRKSGLEALPELLQPLEPLTKITLPPEDSEMADIAGQLDQFSFEVEDVWSF